MIVKLLAYIKISQDLLTKVCEIKNFNSLASDSILKVSKA